MAKVGVFDSGIGGLTNLFGLIKKYPNHYIYVADQKNNPYGTKSKEELLVLAQKVINFLISKECTTIIIACNTICANVLDELERIYSKINFIGVIKPTIDYMNQSSFEKILLIATPATISSKAYLKNNDKEMLCLATPKFVPAIENMDNQLITSAIEEYLSPYKRKVDAICLGCTHYPIIEEKIKSYLNVPTIHSIELLSLEKCSELIVEIYTTKDKKSLENQIQKLFNLDYKVNKLEEQNENYCVFR